MHTKIPGECTGGLPEERNIKLGYRSVSDLKAQPHKHVPQLQARRVNNKSWFVEYIFFETWIKWMLNSYSEAFPIMANNPHKRTRNQDGENETADAITHSLQCTIQKPKKEWKEKHYVFWFRRQTPMHKQTGSLHCEHIQVICLRDMIQHQFQYWCISHGGAIGCEGLYQTIQGGYPYKNDVQLGGFLSRGSLNDIYLLNTWTRIRPST